MRITIDRSQARQPDRRPTGLSSHRERQDDGKNEENEIPVMSEADFSKAHNGDTHFDYQGFVDSKNGRRVYRDTIATNGILRNEEQKGISIHTNGSVPYEGLGSARGVFELTGPEQVGEYAVLITIPNELMKKLGLTFDFYKIVKLEDKIADAAPWETEESIKEATEKRWNESHVVTGNQEQTMLIELSIDPRKDEEARKKAEFIHRQALQHLEDGGSPVDLYDLITKLESKGKQEESTLKEMGAQASKIRQQLLEKKITKTN